MAEALDREKTDSYNLIVQAWDNYQYGFSTGESRNAFKQVCTTFENAAILELLGNPRKFNRIFQGPEGNNSSLRLFYFSPKLLSILIP